MSLYAQWADDFIAVISLCLRKIHLSCPLVVLLVVIGVFCLTGNLALSQSVKTGNPVRVIRGYKLPTIFAPESGYRYDGLYNVTKAWLVLVLGFPTRSH